MMHSPRTSPRAEYQQQESLRVQESPALGLRYKRLRALALDLSFFGPEGVTCHSRIKYTVNLEHAKSVFRLGCHNQECIRGDFDLSDVIATAVAAKEGTVTGEICCQGWRNRASIDTLPCHNLLRYKLTLSY